MERYRRTTSAFALCGLNCGLCPRFHTDGASKCPGCGGEDFEVNHPTCAVVTCSKKHGGVEYCFQCADYPCERYDGIGPIDSFISYRRVKENLEKAKADLDSYLEELRRREFILNRLLQDYNDGRRKGLYCLATNDLPLEVLENAFGLIERSESLNKKDEKARAEEVSQLLNAKAREAGIELKLRKP